MARNLQDFRKSPGSLKDEVQSLVIHQIDSINQIH